MQYEISGEAGFADVTIELDQGERITAEPGAMISYSDGISMETGTSGGGILGSAKRMMGGESLFQNTFVANQSGTVTLAPAMPGDIIPKQLNGQKLYAQSGAFLGGEPGVDVSSKMKGAKSFFRGKGLFLLELSGAGTAFLDTYGAVKEVTLEPGERYTVDTGHIVAFDDSVSYTTHKVGGLKGRLFSGEGRVSEFSGPGTVWIQNRDLGAFAGKIAEELPGQNGDGDGGGFNIDF